MSDDTTELPQTTRETDSRTAFAQQVAAGQRFEFGKNWQRFLSVLNEDRIVNAVRSLQQQLGLDRLDGMRFCDAGSGSGLFSLAARRLGATVHSFDFDPSSVGCTQELKRRYFADHPHWTIQQASVLDQDYLKSLGQFDVVYSWGVLHHTGAMWQAMQNVTTLVAPNGRLFIALYNDQGFLSRMWLAVKRTYCCCTLGRWAMTAIWVPGFFARMCVASLVAGRNKFAAYHHERGMSPVHDWIDWIGGLPFEVAKPDDVIRFHEQCGFELLKLTRTKSLGCNQFVFQMMGSLRDESTPNMGYRVEHAASARGSFGVYRYCIYQGDRLIAHYWHDHRGDEHGIEFVNGLSEDCPVGRMTDFLEGGGPESLQLSDNAIAYLTRKLHEKS